MSALPPNAAKWGTACASCAAAKCRCLRSTEVSEKCDRCQTLQKDCTIRVHKVRKKRQSEPSRTALLEKKLESLVELLKATPAHKPTVQASLISPKSPGEESSAEKNTIEVETRSSDQSDDTEIEITHEFPSKFSSIAPPTCICRAPARQEDTKPADTNDILLSIYINQLCAWFPFIIISRDITSSHLQATRPFLLKSIRLVTSLRNIRSMWGQRRAIMQYLSEAVFVRSERSLDLLQGILVLLGFYHYHCLVHIQFNNLMQLAVSISRDMDLNRDPTRRARGRFQGTDGDETRVRSNDERRAIVGVWYMSSNVALTFNKGQSEKFTKYHEQCLEELERENEFESDILLVQLVRIQHLIQRIADCNNQDQLPDELPGIERPPTSVYHAAFQTELCRLQTSLHSSLQKNHLIHNHLNTAHLRLYEPLLQDNHLLDTVSRSLTTLSLSNPATLARFSACHSALQDWFKHWVTIPVCYYFYMSQPLAAQLIYSMMMLSRWAFLFSDHDRQTGANGSKVSDLADPGQISIIHILNTSATRFEAAESEMGAAQGGTWKNGIWDLAARMLRLKKLRIEKRWRVVEDAGGEGIYRFEEEYSGVNECIVDGGFRTDYGSCEPSGRIEEPFNFGAVGGDDWLWVGDLFDGVDINQGSFFSDSFIEMSGS